MKRETIIILVIFLCLGLCYLVFGIDYDKPKKLDINYKNGNNVLIKNILPVSDTIGKKYNGSGSEKNIQELKEFVIKNDNDSKISYTIYIKPNIVDSKTIKTNYIKVYLTDEFDKPLEGFEKNRIPAISDLTVSNNNPDKLILYEGMIKKDEEQKFKLRSWLADSYAVTEEEQIYDFDIEIKNK